MDCVYGVHRERGAGETVLICARACQRNDQTTIASDDEYDELIFIILSLSSDSGYSSSTRVVTWSICWTNIATIIAY